MLDPELAAPPLDPDAAAADELGVPPSSPVETLPPEDDPHAASVATRAKDTSFDGTEISLMTPEQWRQRAKSVSPPNRSSPPANAQGGERNFGSGWLDRGRRRPALQVITRTTSALIAELKCRDWLDAHPEARRASSSTSEPLRPERIRRSPVDRSSMHTFARRISSMRATARGGDGVSMDTATTGVRPRSAMPSGARPAHPVPAAVRPPAAHRAPAQDRAPGAAAVLVGPGSMAASRRRTLASAAERGHAGAERRSPRMSRSTSRASNKESRALDAPPRAGATSTIPRTTPIHFGPQPKAPG